MTIPVHSDFLHVAVKRKEKKEKSTPLGVMTGAPEQKEPSIQHTLHVIESTFSGILVGSNTLTNLAGGWLAILSVVVIELLS